MLKHPVAVPTDLIRAFAAWLKTAPEVPASRVLPPDVSSLAHLGLPQLVTTRLVPAAPARERWERARVISFPERCTLCERAPAHFSTLTRSAGWFRARQTLLERCIPVCEQHIPCGPGFWLEVVPLGRDVAWNIVATCPEFLKDTRRLNEEGDRMPPWHAFPDYPPESSGWRQGEGEYWLQASWRPFWARLEPERRRLYLERWPPPDAWQAALTES